MKNMKNTEDSLFQSTQSNDYYVFKIKDKFGDGFRCKHGKGKVKHVVSRQVSATPGLQRHKFTQDPDALHTSLLLLRGFYFNPKSKGKSIINSLKLSSPADMNAKVCNSTGMTVVVKSGRGIY